jgi:hypothetical protein
VSIALRFRRYIGGNSFGGTVLHHQLAFPRIASAKVQYNDGGDPAAAANPHTIVLPQTAGRHRHHHA